MGAARVCKLWNRDTSAFLTLALGGPAPFGVSGSLWLPRSRESRYHFLQRTVPPTIRISYPITHMSMPAPCSEKHVILRCRLPRSFVTRPGLERVPMALDDRSGFHLSGLTGASGGPPSEAQAASRVRGAHHGLTLSEEPPQAAVFVSLPSNGAVDLSAQARRRDTRHSYGLETARSASAAAP
jgi:hypothetical protein